MAVDLADYQLEGAKEFLTNLALLTVGTTNLDPLMENYYNGHNVMIERINRLNNELELEKEYMRTVEEEMRQRIVKLECAVRELKQPILTNELVTHLDPQIEQEIRELISMMIHQFADGPLNTYIYQGVRNTFNNIRF